MMTLYHWDNLGVFMKSSDVDPRAPLPFRSTPIPPPEATLPSVAVWQNEGWTILPERPEPPVPPEPQPQPEVYPSFTPLEMLDLFTDDEQLAVVGATMSIPAVKLWYDRLIAATFVSYEDPRTEGGLQALVDAGLLEPTRKSEIVAAMQPHHAST